MSYFFNTLQFKKFNTICWSKLLIFMLILVTKSSYAQAAYGVGIGNGKVNDTLELMSRDRFMQLKKDVYLKFDGQPGDKDFSEVSLPAQSYEVDLARYYKVHRTLRTLGWTTLGTGVPLFCLGVAFEIGSIDGQNGSSAERTAKWMIPSGAALSLASIPCFIISRHYKMKEASFSLTNQQTFFLQKNAMASSTQPMLSLKIPL